MHRRKLVRMLAFGAIVAGVFVVALGAKRGRRPATALKAPAGGAAHVDDFDGARSEDGGALIEDARLYAVKAWSFELERYDVRIEDVAMTTAFDDVLSRTGAELVVNGGFFDPDGKPVGLVMSDGVVLSKFVKGLSGGVIAIDGSSARLIASEEFKASEGGKFAIQCRPRLVVDRAANVKGDDGKRAERTALCIREGGRVLDVVLVRGSEDGESPGPSLFALAQYLVGSGCDAALNLDGGPSTGASWREGDAVKLLAPRGPVRHVMAFRKR